MPYFVMSCDGEYPSAAVNGPEANEALWMSGAFLSNVSGPFNYIIDVDYPGNLVALYAGASIPLMRDDLISALKSAGVDNLQLFDAVIIDTETGKKHTHFKAFNVVGLVSAANMEKSALMPHNESDMIDVDFESLVIDEKKASPFKLFRLAENISAIIVDDVVKQEVERQGIPGMIFYDPEDWCG